MCDPVSLTVAATTVAALGQGYSALSTSAQSTYEARVATQNAHLEHDRAADALDRGRTEAIRFGLRANQEAGEQRAALAANGIDVDYGSAGIVQDDLHRAQMQDSITIYKNAAREAQGYEINSANYRSEAIAKKAGAKSAIVSGLFNMGSTVLGGATQVSKIKAGQRFGV